MAIKRSATMSLPCLEPKDEDDDDDYDCFIPLWRVLNIREGLRSIVASNTTTRVHAQLVRGPSEV